MITRIEIERNGNEYHVENINTDDIELFLNGRFIAGYDNLTSVFGHCVNDQQFEKDMRFIAQNS